MAMLKFRYDSCLKVLEKDLHDMRGCMYDSVETECY